MLKLLSILISLLLTGTSFAQDADKQKDKEAQDRVRAEGAAGGTGQQLTKEQREAVKSGAAQHRSHSEALGRVKKDEEQKAEVRDEQSSDRQKGRGAQ